MRQIVFITTILLLFSCGGNSENINEDEYSLELEPTKLYNAEMEWGLVVEPYVKIYPEPIIDDRMEVSLRAGEIVIVDQIILNKENYGSWYHIEWEDKTGWCESSTITLYSSKLLAEVAKSLM